MYKCNPDITLTRQQKKKKKKSQNAVNKNTQEQGEPPMDYPPNPYPWHPIWHYPDCNPAIGEDNGCKVCMPIRILADKIEEAKEDLRMTKWDMHVEGWDTHQGGANVIEVHNKFYDPSTGIYDRSNYKEARNNYNTALKARIKEVDEWWTKCRNSDDPMDLDQEEPPKEDTQDMDIDQQPESIIIKDGKLNITLSWTEKGITIDEETYTWKTIKQWQNKIRRQTKDPLRIRAWKGPYADCWCILENGTHKVLDDGQECTECEYWVATLNYISQLPEEAKKSLLEKKVIHPWFTPKEVADERWYRPNLAETFKVQLLTKHATKPTKAYTDDAAWDIYAAEDCKSNKDGVAVIPTHIKLKYKKGHYGQLLTKSSQAIAGKIVLGGILDEGYRGEVRVMLAQLHKKKFEVKKGEKVAQLRICKQVDQPMEDVQKDNKKEERGIKGFGSSGKWARPKMYSKKSPKVFKFRQNPEKTITEEQNAQLSKLLKKHQTTFVENSSSQGKFHIKCRSI